MHYADMDLADEKQLVEAAKTDPQTFGLLFDRYYRPIFGYILKRTADLALAEDLTSTTFFKALEHLPRFTWRNVPFSAWLYRIATNEINGHFRKQKYQPTSLDTLLIEQGFELANQTDLEQEVIAAENELERHQLWQIVQTKLLTLPIKYQEVLALRYFEDKKITEISLILNKREGTVKSLLSRGLQQLREQLHLEKERTETQPLAVDRIIASEGRKSILSGSYE